MYALVAWTTLRATTLPLGVVIVQRPSESGLDVMEVTGVLDCTLTLP